MVVKLDKKVAVLCAHTIAELEEIYYLCTY